MTYLPKTINWVENVRFCVYIWWQDELLWKFGGKKMSNFREVEGVREWIMEELAFDFVF